MPYPEALVQPMRHELTRMGVEELRDATAVDDAIRDAESGTMAVIVNSVCGCAAANARPAVALARQHPSQPDKYVTVFAGQDLEATARMREHLAGIPPSSPFIALFKDAARTPSRPISSVHSTSIAGRTEKQPIRLSVRMWRSKGTAVSLRPSGRFSRDRRPAVLTPPTSPSLRRSGG
jgi:putative YphP/YqiW family bacilliredoxin